MKNWLIGALSVSLVGLFFLAFVCPLCRCERESSSQGSASADSPKGNAVVSPRLIPQFEDKARNIKAKSEDECAMNGWALFFNFIVALGTTALAVIGYRAAEIAIRTLRAIEQQTTHAGTTAEAAKDSANAAKDGVNALLATERAWLDGDIIDESKLIGVFRYTLRVRNLGRTPAQIRSYNVSLGPLSQGRPFSIDSLPHSATRYMQVFIASGEVKPLQEDIDLDEMFGSAINSTDWGTSGAFCVTILYADILTGMPKGRPEHETSFVYLYTPMLHKIERLSLYNKYT